MSSFVINLLISVQVSLLVLLIVIGCSRSSPPVWIEGWQEGPKMAEARTGAKAVLAGNHLYVMGGGRGIPGPDTIHSSVEHARINSDGSISSWRKTSPFNTPRMFLASVESNNVVYALGGEFFPKGQMKLLNSVERAKILPDGNLEPWIDSQPMQTPRRSPTTVVVDNYLYAIGGYNGTFLQTVERARILADGDLGPWEYVPQRLTTPRYIHGGTARGNRIYIFGGHIQQGGGGSSAAEWTTVSTDGTLAPWKVTSPLNQSRFLAGTTVTDRYIFIVGGYDRGYMNSIELAKFESNGTLSVWTQTTPLSSPREGCAVAVLGDNLYVMGGSNKGEYLRQTEHAKILEGGSLGYWQSH